MSKAIKNAIKSAPGIRKVIAERDALREQVSSLAAELESLKQLSGSLERELENFRTCYAPGHFYSPIPDVRQLQKYDDVFEESVPTELPGITLDDRHQQTLLHEIAKYYPELPFKAEPTPGLRYYFENPNYSYNDAIFLYSMMRMLRPRRIIEVGCGFSSCVFLDTNELFFNNSIDCTFIDPYPQLLEDHLKPGDSERVRLVHDYVQNVPPSVFQSLAPNDILFIDSGHVLKTSGDLNYLLFYVLPYLQAGVFIHFHDIFFPFEYPKEWIYETRGWNECYALRAFLQYNTAFEILCFNGALANANREFFNTHMPLCLRNTGGSLWIRKLAPPAKGELPHRLSPGIPQPQLTRRVDAVHLDHPKQLGLGWHEFDKSLARRWMRPQAEVWMKGPAQPGQKLVLKAWQPNPSGSYIKVAIDDTDLGEERLTAGMVEVALDIPDQFVGRDEMRVRLVTNEFHAPGDPRVLGLGFGTLEIV